ncbi:MAG TPA: glycosyltransferase 87 family protein [Arthrobacter sp.]|nr:glycosyltransferase 87 family protein [Arthrobacter sp.]
MKEKINPWDVARLLVPLFIAAFLFRQALQDGLDLRVYWAAAREFISGGELYAPGLPGTPYGGMAFTYPPFAAAVLSPMALLPVQAALVLQALSNLVIAAIIGTVVTQYLVHRSVARTPGGPAQFLIASLFITGLFLLLGPWRNSLGVGQINPLLMVLILLDLLGSTRRHPNGFVPRGVLTGIAAGLKLTPLVFLLYFVVRGDFKSAARMAATFVATVGLMALLAPSLSAQYWLSALQDTSRVGTLARFENISLRGFLARLPLDSGTASALWIVASLAVTVMAAIVIYRMRRLEDQWVPVSAAALVMLLVSPVSWSHHWVWVAAIVPAMIGRYVQTTPQPFRWLRFLRSWPGALSVVLVASFALQAPEAAILSGSPAPYAGISTFSEFVVQFGIFGGVLILAWYATLTVPGTTAAAAVLDRRPTAAP